MSLRNLHVNANTTDSQLIERSSGFLTNLVGSFRQAVANGHFRFGGIKIQDHDLNRLHAIVTEIDSRRLFWNCSDDESPKWAMASLYEVRNELRKAAKGVWADPSCEAIVQAIAGLLSDFATKAEKLAANELSRSDPSFQQFYDCLCNMRLQVWILVAILKKKVGSVIRPRNLPREIDDLVSVVDV